MPTVDNLDIALSAEATKASDSLDRLVVKLNTLSSSLAGVNGGAMSQFARAMSSFKSLKFPDVSRMANGIEKLSVINPQAITTAGIAMERIAQSMRVFDSIKISDNATQVASISNAIAKLGNPSTSKAIQNIPQLATAMKQFMATLSQAPRVSRNLIDMTNAMGRLARTGTSSGKAATALSKGLNVYSASASRASRSSKSLASAIGKVYATYWLLFRAFGKIGEAIETASSLTEVQNVVDVTFGNMSRKLEEFTETSIQTLGMSELTAKQIASRYQAMGTAMGFSTTKMADMSIEITKLAADMASFYNVEQTDVAEDLESIFTGMTRPLRAYGLDLTEATLKEWALKNGLDANIDSMSQAEKTMLRYQYVMANTTAAQGDFLRTQDTWANQTRILKENLTALSAVIGQNFINALKPLVSALNTVILKFTQFAEVVTESLGEIFGWTKDKSSGFTVDMEDGAEYADDLAGGLGAAAKNAKELNRQTRDFDELKVLTTDKGKSGGGGGGASADEEMDMPGYSYVGGALSKMTEAYESEIDTLYKLGEHINKTLTKTLTDIDWDSIYQGARNFGTGLSDFLNGLISPEGFSAVASTIAGALNTAIYAKLSFGQNFEWDEFGLSLAESVNTFFSTFDFGALGESISTWVHGLKDALITFVAEVDWKDVLKGIGEIFSSMGADTVALIFGFKALSSIFKTTLLGALGSSLRTTTTLPAGLVTGLGNISNKIFTGLLSSLATAFVGFNLGEYLYEAMTGDDTSDIDYGSYFSGAAKATVEEWKNAIIQYVKNDIVTTDEYSSNPFRTVENKELKTNNKTLDDNATLVTKAGKGYDSYNEKVQKAEELAEKYNLALNLTNDEFDDLKEQLDNSTYSTNQFADSTDQATYNIASKYSMLSTNMVGSMINTARALDENYSYMSNAGGQYVNNMRANMLGPMEQIEVEGTEYTRALNQAVTSNYSTMSKSGSASISTLAKSTSSSMQNMATESASGMSKVNNAVNSGMSKVNSTVNSGMAKATASITKQDWKKAGTDLVNGLQEGLSATWTVGLTTKVLDLANNLTNTLKKGFDIHSPSRLWRRQIGQQLPLGLAVGIDDTTDEAIGSAENLFTGLNNVFSKDMKLNNPIDSFKSEISQINSNLNTSVSARATVDSTSVMSNFGNAFANSQAQQNEILREQNSLLMQILNKEFGITQDEVYNAVSRVNRQRYNATGVNALVY